MPLDITALSKAIADTKHTLQALDRASVEKTIWSSPAGKKRIAKRLAALLPPHKTYVEPFAGSAAVLFAKEPSEVEVINDADPEIVQAYRIIQRLSKDSLERLGRMKWTGDEATFKRLVDAKPSGDVAKLHRFLYVTHFSYGKMRGKSFSPSTQGIQANTFSRIETHMPRLKNVKIHGGDYERVIRQYDGPNTAFYLDPPYPGYDVHVGESKFDEENFYKVLKSIKGKFLMTYGIRGKLPGMLKSSGFTVKRIRTPRHIRSMRGVGGPSVLTQLLVTNYSPAKKSLDAMAGDDWEISDWADENDAFAKSVPLIKGTNPEDERYVLGIVLEPEVVDAQGDIYSIEEIRQAAHRFMEEFGGVGLMHRFRVNGDVKILESYLAPTNLEIAGTNIRQGTWLLAVRILSDALWEKVKTGELSGFSIGGSARRTPENHRPKECGMSGQQEKTDPLHRLFDMIVEEVSLVDRAANQRRFLVVKRSDDMEETTKTEQGEPGEVESDGPELPAGEETESGTDNLEGETSESSPVEQAIQALDTLLNTGPALAGLHSAAPVLEQLAAKFKEVSVALSGNPGGEAAEEEGSHQYRRNRGRSRTSCFSG